MQRPSFPTIARLDGRHLAREASTWSAADPTPWAAAGTQVHDPRLVQGANGLLWAFAADGKEVGAKGRWESYAAGGRVESFAGEDDSHEREYARALTADLDPLVRSAIPDLFGSASGCANRRDSRWIDGPNTRWDDRTNARRADWTNID